MNKLIGIVIGVSMSIGMLSSQDVKDISVGFVTGKTFNNERYSAEHIGFDFSYVIGNGIEIQLGYQNAFGSLKASKVLSGEDIDFLELSGSAVGNAYEVSRYSIGFKKLMQLNPSGHLFLVLNSNYNRVNTTELGDIKLEDGIRIRQIRSVFSTYDKFGFGLRSGYQYDLGSNSHCFIYLGYASHPQLLDIGIGFIHYFNLKS